MTDSEKVFYMKHYEKAFKILFFVSQCHKKDKVMYCNKQAKSKQISSRNETSCKC